MRKLVILALALLMLAPMGCTKKGGLVFAVIPSEDATATQETWTEMIDYLSAGMGQKIELMVVSDYTAVIEAMRYGHADIARLSPAGYAMAIEDGVSIDPIAFAVKSETGLPGYYAMLVARAETDTSDLNALTFGFVDVGSTSGYIAPAIYLRQEDVTPAEILFAGSHPAVILAVKNGSVDVGAIASNRYAVAIAEDVIGADEFKVVWQSPLIPNCPIAVQADMPERDKAKLTALFLDAPESIVASIGTNETQYVKVTDSEFDPIREIIRFKSQ